MGIFSSKFEVFNNLLSKVVLQPVYHENNPHLDKRYFFSYFRMFMEIFYPAMVAAGAAPSMEPLAPGGPKIFGRGPLTKGLHGRGGSRCRHCWIRYFHKHARLTERSICYLDEDYFHDKPPC